MAQRDSQHGNYILQCRVALCPLKMGQAQVILAWTVTFLLGPKSCPSLSRFYPLHGVCGLNDKCPLQSWAFDHLVPSQQHWGGGVRVVETCRRKHGIGGRLGDSEPLVSSFCFLFVVRSVHSQLPVLSLPAACCHASVPPSWSLIPLEMPVQNKFSFP